MLLFLFLLVGCQSNRVGDCAGCVHDLFLWRTAVDTITLANFPEEEFNAVVHYEDFSNAWVSTGNEINITANLLHELSKEQRIAVAAHEIAHLKAGHYYTKLGVSILTSIGFSVLNVFVPRRRVFLILISFDVEWLLTDLAPRPELLIIWTRLMTSTFFE